MFHTMQSEALSHFSDGNHHHQFKEKSDNKDDEAGKFVLLLLFDCISCNQEREQESKLMDDWMFRMLTNIKVRTLLLLNSVNG